MLNCSFLVESVMLKLRVLTFYAKESNQKDVLLGI